MPKDREESSLKAGQGVEGLVPPNAEPLLGAGQDAWKTSLGNAELGSISKTWPYGFKTRFLSKTRNRNRSQVHLTVSLVRAEPRATEGTANQVES